MTVSDRQQTRDPMAAIKSEMASQIAALDWSRTSIGAPDSWPAQLRTSLDICLASRFPMVVWWGRDYVKLYNDAYTSMLGSKHPSALGQRACDVWPEIWDVIGPMLDQVFNQAQATWSEDQLLVLNRDGYNEECYFTFSYSPIAGPDGATGGIFTAVSETTTKVIGERRLRTTRELMPDAQSVDEAVQRAAVALARNALDIPCAIIYVVDDDGCIRLGAHAGIDDNSTLRAGGDLPAVVARVASTGVAETISDLVEIVTRPPSGPWPEAPATAYAMPIARAGSEAVAAVAILGVSARRAFDDTYRQFFEVVGGQIAAAIASGRTREEERERAAQLAELDRAKTAFFSNVSHEFRTPLTLLLGPLDEMLADGDDGLRPDQRHQLEVASRNSRRLLRLVNTLLDFSRIEAGRVDASYEPTDVSAYTAELAQMFLSAFERTAVELIIDCPPASERAYIDRDMWEKIVLNLLSNAFKFTFEGEVRIAVRTDDSGCRLIVSDSGVGVPANELPRLFERFHRVHGARARTQEGSGIGLSLIRELARLHGGDVAVESVEGKGTTFTVSIPLGTEHLDATRIGAARQHASTATGAEPYVQELLRWLPDDAAAPSWINGALHEARADASARPAATARILFVDDNADMREYVRGLLAPHWHVDCVGDGQAALDAAIADAPDLVLSDVMMPRLDGMQLVQALRADPRTAAVPVILMSARAGDEAIAEGLESAADDYLVKPFSARELIARVGARIEISQVHGEAERRWRAMANGTPAMIAEARIDGGMTSYNDRWLAYSGLSQDDLREDGWVSLIHPDDRERFLTAWAKAREDDAEFSEELLLKRHDGAFRCHICHGSPVRDHDGVTVSWVGITFDIEDRKQMENELRRANAAKDEFLGLVSHELRTPITTIMGNAEILRRRGADLTQEARDSALGDIADEAVRLNRIIINLLLLARLEQGQEIDVEPIMPERDAQRVIANFEKMHAPRAVRLTCASTAPVLASATYFEQVLMNLLSNADKYSPKQALIDVSIERTGDLVAFTVSDRGAGIPDADRDHVFEPFYRSNDAVATAPGIGIGLAVCRRLVTAQGGEIEAQRRPGGGTTLRFTLPAVE